MISEAELLTLRGVFNGRCHQVPVITGISVP